MSWVRLLACAISLLLVTMMTAAPTRAVSRCIISEDLQGVNKQNRVPMVDVNIDSLRDFRRVSLLNAKEVSKDDWYAVIDADAEFKVDPDTQAERVVLKNVVRVTDPPAGQWLNAVRAACRCLGDDRARAEAKAFILAHPDTDYAANAVHYWAETYEAKGQWAQAVEVYQAYLREHPQSKGIDKLQRQVKRIEDYGFLTKPNWARCVAEQSEIGRRVQNLKPEARAGAEGKELRDLLVKAIQESRDLKDVERERRSLAKMLWGCLGKDDVGVLQDLLLNEKDDIAEGAAAKLFEYAKDGAAGSLDVLAAGLKAEDPRVRKTCAEIAGDLAHAPAISSLVKLLSDKDASVRLAAVSALGRMRAKEAEARLKEIRQADPDESVRKAAENALGRMGTTP